MMITEESAEKQGRTVIGIQIQSGANLALRMITVRVKAIVKVFAVILQLSLGSEFVAIVLQGTIVLKELARTSNVWNAWLIQTVRL